MFCSDTGIEKKHPPPRVHYPISEKEFVTAESYLRVEGSTQLAMLNRDTQLFPHHVDSRRRYDFSKPVAAVVQHPKNPNIWHIKNLSRKKWVSTATDGTVRDVPPNRSVTLAVGTKINFGKSEGEIRA